MKLVIALAVFILMMMPKVNASPSPQIDNSTVDIVVAQTQPIENKHIEEVPSPVPPVTVVTEKITLPVSSDPKTIARATLIDLGQGDAWYAVEYIGFKESSWNPRAINNIGACGLFQALPCEKMNCSLSDVACQVRWATNYATQRYGSWHQAYSFWLANNYW